MSIAGMAFMYIFTSVFALYVAVFSFLTALRKKQSSMQKMLYLAAFWNLLIPFLMLAHYLEGFHSGSVAIILNTIILMLANTQVIIFMYTMEKFIAILCNFTATDNIYTFMKYWYIFWMTVKLICGSCVLAGELSGNVAMYNGSQLAFVCTILIEVGANSFRGGSSNFKLIRHVKILHGNIQSANNPVVLEFAERVEKSRYVLPIYGVIFVSVGIAVPILYLMYDSSIPYAFVIYGIMVMTWPTVGLRPLLILRTQIGQHLGKAKLHSSTAPGSPDQKQTHPRSSDQSKLSPYSRNAASDGNRVTQGITGDISKASSDIGTDGTVAVVVGDLQVVSFTDDDPSAPTTDAKSQG